MVHLWFTTASPTAGRRGLLLPSAGTGRYARPAFPAGQRFANDDAEEAQTRRVVDGSGDASGAGDELPADSVRPAKPVGEPTATPGTDAAAGPDQEPTKRPRSFGDSDRSL